jgi:hypothetical protein
MFNTRAENPKPIKRRAARGYRLPDPVAGRVEPPGTVEGVVGVVVGEEGSVVVAPRTVVVVTGACTHEGSVNVFVSRVTAPFRARSRPSMRAFVVAVIDESARTDPLNWELVPSVAELPTCQNTRQAFAPLVRIMVLDDAVISVESV